MLIPILRIIGHMGQFSASGEGTLLNSLIITALNVSNSKDVDTFELCPTELDAFCNGFIHQDCV